MGLKVVTDGKPVTIYRQDKESQGGIKYTQYSIGVASKNANGEWVNGFIDCQFRKGVDIPNKSKIFINNSFYTVSEFNGKKYYKIFVMDYQMESAGTSVNNLPTNDMGFLNIPDGIAEENPFD